MIPKTAANNTEHTITVTMASQKYPENIRSFSQELLVQGIYQESSGSTEDNEQDDDMDSSTPGFQLFSMLVSFMVAMLIIIQKKAIDSL